MAVAAAGASENMNGFPYVIANDVENKYGLPRLFETSRA